MDIKNETIKIAQINLQRAKHATNQFNQHIAERNIAVALVQEPHTRAGRVIGMGKNTRVINKIGSNPWAAIVLIDPKIEELFMGNAA